VHVSRLHIIICIEGLMLRLTPTIYDATKDLGYALT
jgi:hypothetical protein